MASEVAFMFGSLGTPLVIQIGSCGALQREIKIGQFIIPTEAEKGEGISPHYLKKNEKADASSDVIRKLSRIIKEKGLAHHAGKIYTVPACSLKQRKTYINGLEKDTLE
jgi:uridine phosphorylase